MSQPQMRNDLTMEQAAALFKALGDPNRLKILDLLMQGDSCNCELKDKLGLPPNLLSHHLGVLRKTGLVNSRRDAIDSRWIYYAVDPTAAAGWCDWFHQFLNPERLHPRQVLCGPEGQLVEEPTTMSAT